MTPYEELNIANHYETQALLYWFAAYFLHSDGHTTLYLGPLIWGIITAAAAAVRFAKAGKVP